MAAEFDRQKKHSMKSEARRVDAGSGGGIIVIGGALIAAAISAAFVAHRARRNAGSKSRNDKALSVDGSAGCQESESEKGDEGISEGTWDSSVESGVDKVWPEEVIDRRKQPPELEGHPSEVESQSTGSIGSKDNGEEEFSFASSVETRESLSNYCVIIEETREIHDSCKISDTIVETEENQTEPSLVGDANSDMSKTPKIVVKEPDVGHVGGEEDHESEGSRNSSADSSRLDVWPADPTEQENVDVYASIIAEIPGKMREMDGSAGDIYRNIDLVREPMLSDVTEIDMQGNDAAENLKGSAKEADRVKEEEMNYHVDEESEAEGSMETGNPPMGFDGNGICPTEMVELEKASEFLNDTEEPEVAHIEEKEELGGVDNSISDGVAEGDNDNLILIQLEAEAVQGGEGDYERQGSSSNSMEEELRSPIEEENEREGSMETCNSSMEFDGQGACAAALAELDKDSAPMHEMQAVVNMQKSISGDSSVSVQEEMCMDLDAETEESKQTFNNSEMVIGVAPGIDFGAEEASGFLQVEEESEVSHVEEEEEEEEEDTKSSVDGERKNKASPDSFSMMSASTNSQRDACGGGGQPSTEKEMKLQFEATTKAADISSAGQADQEEHEHEAKEKRTYYALIGSPKAFILVLALALAVVLLAFFHHEQISQYNHGFPKIYDQLYELFFRSHNRAIGEL